MKLNETRLSSYVESFLNRESFRQFVKVGVVGVVNTVVSFALFNLFLIGFDWASVASVSVAFAITTFLSYLLNRRWTFELRDGKLSGRETSCLLPKNRNLPRREDTW